MSISTRSRRRGRRRFPALIARGKALFKAKFTTEDGAGRPKATQAIVPTKRKFGVNPAFTRTSGPDSNSCFGCHNDPIEGGSGDFVSDVFVSEGFESAQFELDRPLVLERATHDAADGRRPGRAAGARDDRRPAEPSAPTAVEQARAERPGRRAPISSARACGSARSPRIPTASSTSIAIEGVDADLIVRPFSRKGVFTSLRQFTINALNVHHGMEASERFGVRWTGSHDFDESGVPDAVTPGDVSALVAFQATLPPPTVKSDLPDDWRVAAAEGAQAIRGARLRLLPSARRCR